MLWLTLFSRSRLGSALGQELLVTDSDASKHISVPENIIANRPTVSSAKKRTGFHSLRVDLWARLDWF